MNREQIEYKRKIESEITTLFNKQEQVNLKKTKLKVGQKDACHEFDIYEKGKFIGGISTSPWTNKTPRRSTNTGGQDRVSTELLWLTLWVGKEQRVVILTDEEMATRTLQRWQGCPFTYQIKIIHYDDSKRLFETVGVLDKSYMDGV